jgi:RNA polymerase sigma-70 factor (ECF subfamily)
VSDYLDDELPAEQRHVVESHLATCPTCPPLYASLVTACHVLGGLRDRDDVVPPAVASRIAELLR